MKGSIKRQLIIILCLVIAGLAVGVGVNFSLNQRFDFRIEEEKRQELDEKLQTLLDGLQTLPAGERTEAALRILFEPSIMDNHDLVIGYFNRAKEMETIMEWDKAAGSVQIRQALPAYSMEVPNKPREADRPEIRRERDKIRTMRPIFEGEKVNGFLWIEDSIISDIQTFMLVRVLTGLAVLFSLFAGIIGTSLLIRRLIRDIEGINKGVDLMKRDLGHRIEVSSNELGDVAREINLMAEQLQAQKRLEERLHRADKMAALGQFVSGIAHELRNPLGIIKGSLQLMEKEGDFGGEQKEFLKVVQEQIERQNRIIEELLQFARPSKPDFEPADVEALLDSLMVFVGAYLRDGRIELDRKRTKGLRAIMADAEKIKQVFLNLILNAVQAMPDGGRLTIETENMGEDRIAIRFIDSGEGIPEEAATDIFNPYYTTRDEGTGLGLSISYQLVSLHGGSIEAKNGLKEGSVITVVLPAVKA